MQDTAGEARVKLVSDVLLWNLIHGYARVGRPARTYLHQLCIDTGWNLEDLAGVRDDRDGWRGRVRETSAVSAT